MMTGLFEFERRARFTAAQTAFDRGRWCPLPVPDPAADVPVVTSDAHARSR
jgi:hypothetical protein